MMDNNEQRARQLQKTGEWVLRYGLVLVIFWIGCLKFTAYEAQGIQALVAHSPLLSWAYRFLDVRSFSTALGTVEVTVALLIALRPVSPRVSALGSLGAIAMFLTTLSFLLTTPGVWQSGYGFPALSGAIGGFLIKDVVLLGASLWTGGEALLAASRQRQPIPRAVRAPRMVEVA